MQAHTSSTKTATRKMTAFAISDKQKYRLKLLALASPFVLLLILFQYVPLFGWSYAFLDYMPGVSIWKMDFVGLHYFKLIFSGGSELVPVLKNTLALSGLIILTMPVPMIFAILLSQMKSVKYSKFVQSVTTIPFFISFILIFGVVFALFSTEDGLVNIALMKLNLIEDPLNPLANSDMAWYYQTLLHLFKTTGYNAIIYIAAIAGIDSEMYDAADVDGASRYQKIWYVTIPSLLPTFFVLLLFGIAGILSASGFDQYYVFRNPLTINQIDVIDTYTYDVGIVQSSYALGTALGIAKSLISLFLLFFANYLSKVVRGNSIV
ncbi:ABC transporter permease subunit [Cohnella soli]|uniref:ABC transporter permease subunit n=1 Tax=Cohnella soli TaxID=425005 RepID=A0ABW0HXX2_9BACL